MSDEKLKALRAEANDLLEAMVGDRLRLEAQTMRVLVILIDLLNLLLEMEEPG